MRGRKGGERSGAGRGGTRFWYRVYPVRLAVGECVYMSMPCAMYISSPLITPNSSSNSVLPLPSIVRSLFSLLLPLLGFWLYLTFPRDFHSPPILRAHPGYAHTFPSPRQLKSSYSQSPNCTHGWDGWRLLSVGITWWRSGVGGGGVIPQVTHM